ncbi:hypothetical protein Pmani_007192 [Petrolisthes manimaculis]|uniref:Uncharacterized protein n=1 Tax=Petrolisthes manimaculis TaxID=1843537 RepID=A0AAE1UL02_9EUCA|nr:hypothetical protein Pmani_007192 [Petrolisthes manimaculis]
MLVPAPTLTPTTGSPPPPPALLPHHHRLSSPHHQLSSPHHQLSSPHHQPSSCPSPSFFRNNSMVEKADESIHTRAGIAPASIHNNTQTHTMGQIDRQRPDMNVQTRTDQMADRHKQIAPLPFPVQPPTFSPQSPHLPPPSTPKTTGKN